MSNHSFICNVCYNLYTNKEQCKNCNGLGKNFEPTCKEKYEKDPQKYIKRLILACR